MNLSKSISNSIYHQERKNLINDERVYQIYSTLSFNQKPVLYNIELLLITYFMDDNSVFELISIFINELTNIRFSTFIRLNKKYEQHNHNEKNNVFQEGEDIEEKKKNLSVISSSTNSILMEMDEWKNHNMDLLYILLKEIKLNKINVRNENDIERYNGFYRNIWNIYCMFDSFYKILNKYFIFQNMEIMVNDTKK